MVQALERSTPVDEYTLQESGFTCAATPAGQTTCVRVLWEDDRFGRVSEVMELPNATPTVMVELPSGRTAAGQVRWKPLELPAGTKHTAVRSLLTLIRELAGDVYVHTTPLRAVEPFEFDDETSCAGLA